MSVAKGPRLALVCLYPDWGHVKPLVGIAREAERNGFDVRLFVPDKMAPLAVGLPTTLLNIHADMAGLFRPLSRKSLFFMNFSGFSHGNLLVYPHLIEQVAAEFGYVQSELETFSPDLIVCDVHLFGEVYQRFAQVAPLLVNDPSGTLGGYRRRYDRAFGLRSIPSPVKTAVEVAGAAHEFVYRRAFYLLHWREFLRARRAKKALGAAVGDLPPRAPSAKLTLGLGWIERELLAEAGLGNDKAYFPPVAASPEPLAPDLADWLASKDRVIYVSLGSLVSLQRAELEMMATALKETGLPVIWSVRDEDVRRLVGHDPLFFVAPYVAQATLLQDSRISLFVTHAGASSVQEALVGGTPMVCIPFFADQGYIASLVERLGAGTVLPKRRLRSLPSAIAQALKCAEQASAVAQRIPSTNSDLAAFLSTFVAEPSAAGEPIQQNA